MYTNDIEGWMEQTELEWLYSIASEMESIVEIGSWKGRSIHALCTRCKGTVTAIDLFMILIILIFRKILKNLII